MYISSCLFSLIWSGLLVTSWCILSLSPALSCLDVIKYYYLSLRPRLRVPVPPSCVHRDRRPDLTVSGTPSPRFVFCFLKSFYFVPVCLSRGKEVATRPSALARVKTAWEFGGIAASPLAAMPSCPPIVGDIHRRPASDSMPAGSPLTQARRIRL